MLIFFGALALNTNCYIINAFHLIVEINTKLQESRRNAMLPKTMNGKEKIYPMI
jgi:hypothetical protein